MYYISRKDETYPPYQILPIENCWGIRLPSPYFVCANKLKSFCDDLEKERRFRGFHGNVYCIKRKDDNVIIYESKA